MRDGLTRIAAQVSIWAGRLAMALAVLVLALMLAEVFGRYGLGKPIRGSDEIVAMLNGCMFLFACALALRRNAHVSVDALSARLAPAMRALILALFSLLVFIPVLLWIEAALLTRLIAAWRSGEVPEVSALRYPIWPYYAALATALATFLLQLIADMVERFASLAAPRHG
jgi:TRAP-type mannitol/chloroaromatic compound transport system permease small subunit